MGVRGQPTKWDKWYSTARWVRIRKHQLLEHPLCKYCLERGIVTPAEICDRIGAISTDSGSVLSSRFARNVTTPPRDLSRSTVSVAISAWMGGLWTRAARPIESADPGHRPIANHR